MRHDSFAVQTDRRYMHGKALEDLASLTLRVQRPGNCARVARRLTDRGPPGPGPLQRVVRVMGVFMGFY